jgi:fluoroacetyl-CoA thioesterase
MSGEAPPENSRLEPGLEAEIDKVVPPEWTIAYYDSRLPPVLSTPAMIGMMEVAAAKAVQAALPPGSITVGTRIEVDHLKAVPAGTTVQARARFAGMEGKFLAFEVEARAGETLIGRGRVYRAIVEINRFNSGTGADASKSS